MVTKFTDGPTQEEGFELAIALARKGVGYTHPSAKLGKKLGPEYAENPDSLTWAAQVIGIHSYTVATPIIIGNKLKLKRLTDHRLVS